MARIGLGDFRTGKEVDLKEFRHGIRRIKRFFGEAAAMPDARIRKDQVQVPRRLISLIHELRGGIRSTQV